MATKSQFGKIHFNDVLDKDDGTTMVIVALSMDEFADKNDAMQQMNDYFLGANIFTDENKIVDIEFIDGNVKGKNGRSDWLLTLSKGVRCVSPVGRLRFPDLKWTEDFIANYGKDYGYVPADIELDD